MSVRSGYFNLVLKLTYMKSNKKSHILQPTSVTRKLLQPLHMPYNPLENQNGLVLSERAAKTRAPLITDGPVKPQVILNSKSTWWQSTALAVHTPWQTR